jgi:hypothetical protein
MPSAMLVRLSGLALMAALPASILAEVLHPPAHGLAQQLKSAWTPAHLLLALQALLMVLGLPLMYARQARPAGLLGLVAYVLLFVGLVLSGVTAIYDAFVMPLLAQNPATAALVDANGRLANGPLAAGLANATLRPVLPVLPVGLGGLLFAVVTFRARVYSRWVGLLPMIGFVFGILRYAVPQAWYNAARESGTLPIGFGSIGAIATALGFAVAGYALWAAGGGPRVRAVERIGTPGRADRAG